MYRDLKPKDEDVFGSPFGKVNDDVGVLGRVLKLKDALPHLRPGSQIRFKSRVSYLGEYIVATWQDARLYSPDRPSDIPFFKLRDTDMAADLEREIVILKL